MRSLGSFKEGEYGASASISDINIGVANPFPQALLDLKIDFYAEPILFTNASGKEDRSTATIIYFPEVCEIKFKGNPIAVAVSSDWGFSIPSLYVKVPITIEVIKFLEANRVDDLQLDFKLKISYLVSIDNKREKQLNPIPENIRFTYLVSHAKWKEILKYLGYADRILIEIEKPDIKGYEKVVDFIRKANDGLVNHSSPDSIISDVRSA